jgi:hypothetical protein
MMVCSLLGFRPSVREICAAHNSDGDKVLTVVIFDVLSFLLVLC